MPSRFANQKPDPALRRNVMRTRARMQDAKGERGIVGIASVAATICAWVVFATLGSPFTTTDTVQAADTSQSTGLVSVQTSDGSSSPVSTDLTIITTPTAMPTSLSGASSADTVIGK